MNNITEFPINKGDLWRGAILGGLANAIMTAQNPDLQANAYWDRNHYKLNAGDGREAVISFAGGHWYEHAPLVGVFHDAQSTRTPFRSAEWELERFFEGCPSYNRALADQAGLRHLQIVTCGVVDHRVTTAFWDQGEQLVSIDSWQDFQLHSGEIIELELFDNTDKSIEAVQIAYGMSLQQVALLESLFSRKLARPPASIELDSFESNVLHQHSIDAESLAISMSCLSQLDIIAE